MKITEEQHKNFIWCWKSNKKKNKVSLWIPYFQKAEKLKGDTWKISYNDGEIEIKLEEIDLLMFYGATGKLSLEMLDEFREHKIIFMIYRRNLEEPYYFYAESSNSEEDLITKQILYRDNEIKRTYIARTLLLSRMYKIKEKHIIYNEYIEELKKAKTVNKLRSIEANASNQYWKSYFKKLNKDYIRRGDNGISKALDACSHFLAAIILRWVIFHRLLPNYGYLHTTTDYPSLIYDLIEPYRYFFEETVFDCVTEFSEEDPEFLQKCITRLKAYMEEDVYVPATEQYVSRKNLLHGVVLSLRSYLLGETKKFVIPQEGEKKGGRPPLIAFRLPGEKYLKKERKRG